MTFLGKSWPGISHVAFGTNKLNVSLISHVAFGINKLNVSLISHAAFRTNKLNVSLISHVAFGTNKLNVSRISHVAFGTNKLNISRISHVAFGTNKLNVSLIMPWKDYGSETNLLLVNPKHSLYFTDIVVLLSHSQELATGSYFHKLNSVSTLPCYFIITYFNMLLLRNNMHVNITYIGIVLVPRHV